MPYSLRFFPFSLQPMVIPTSRPGWLLVTAYNITSSFTQPVVGWLSDSKGFSI